MYHKKVSVTSMWPLKSVTNVLHLSLYTLDLWYMLYAIDNETNNCAHISYTILIQSQSLKRDFS